MPENIYLTKLLKIGTSYGVIIPKEILLGYGWKRGDHLVFSFTTEKHLSISRLTEQEIRDIKDAKRVLKLTADGLIEAENESLN